MPGKKITHYRSKYKYQNKPRVGSYALTDQRTGMPTNSDFVIRQWDGVWTTPKYWRPRHPNDYYPTIADEDASGESGNVIPTAPVVQQDCLTRDSVGTIVGVYESSNQFTCEIATAAQTASFAPTITAETFTVLESVVTDWYSLGIVTASDPNSLPLTYAITAGEGGVDGVSGTGDETFFIDPDTGELFIRNVANIDLSDSPYAVTVEVTNRGQYTNLSASAIMSVVVKVWDPAAFGTVGVWMDGQNTANITSSGGAISRIIDSSTAGVDLIQGTAANKPTIVTDGLNNFDTIQLNVTNHVPTQGDSLFMSASDKKASDFKYLHDGSTAWSVIALVKPETPTVVDTGAESTILSTGDDLGTGDEGVQVTYSTSQKEVGMLIRQNLGANGILASTGDKITLDTYAVIIYIHVPNVTAGQTILYTYVNGVLAATANKSSTAYGTTDPDNVLYLGTNAQDGGRMVGEMADVSIIKADVRDDIAVITAAVQEKWGIV